MLVKAITVIIASTCFLVSASSSPFTNDPFNCGAKNNRCVTPTGAQSSMCVQGVCHFTCAKGLFNDGVSCRSEFDLKKRALPSPSAALKKRKVQVDKTSLCPGKEIACPIVGSASFATFSTVTAQDSGGYECLSPNSVDSCGGCGSLSKEFDCSNIPHSKSVGCGDSACVVFSCKKGFMPSDDRKSCVKRIKKRVQPKPANARAGFFSQILRIQLPKFARESS